MAEGYSTSKPNWPLNMSKMLTGKLPMKGTCCIARLSRQDLSSDAHPYRQPI
jgi:hypothetical protein